MYESTEQLEAINGNYRPYGMRRAISQSDLDSINDLIVRIEAERAGGEIIPTNGDRVICQLDTGDIHAGNASLTVEEDGRLEICVHPSDGRPHLLADNLHLPTSGGPFFYARPDELEYVGPVQGKFWTWGHHGAIGGGGINFDAPVHQWRIVAPYRRFI